MVEITKHYGLGVCPKCEGTDLEWGDAMPNDDTMEYNFICKSCGCNAVEICDVVYSCSVYDDEVSNQYCSCCDKFSKEFDKEQQEFVCPICEVESENIPYTKLKEIYQDGKKCEYETKKTRLENGEL